MSAGFWFFASFAFGAPSSSQSPVTEETYHAQGVLASLKNFDEGGKVHGAWLEWWPNGAMKMDQTLSHGLEQRRLDFYPTGKPRLLYTVHYVKQKGVQNKRRFPTLQSWAPNGRPTGMVSEGMGEVMVFHLDDKNDNAILRVVRETYRDSVLKDAETLDTAQAFQRLDSLARAAAKKLP